MRLLFAAALSAILATWGGACVVEVDYGNTSFSCSSGECPDGFDCVENVCVAPGNPPAEPDAAALPTEPDAGLPDADLPDATPPDAEPLLSCDDRFGALPGYMLCSETPESCAFNATTAGGNCDAICLAAESTCLEAFDNADVACERVDGSVDTCQTLRQTEICVCAR